MYINQRNSQQPFTNLYNGANLEKQLAKKNCTKKFLNSLDEIKSIIRKNGFDQKENVDIILDINDDRSFYALVVSKKEGIPMNPNRACEISSNPKVLEQFSNWINNWDANYNPKVIQKMDKWKQQLRIYTRKHIDEILRIRNS